MNAGIIWLSVRHFDEGLLIEVFDANADPPVFTDADEDAESGRGLFIVNALSMKWSYFFPPGGGKVVYCFIRTAMPQRLPHHTPGPCGTGYGTGWARPGRAKQDN